MRIVTYYVYIIANPTRTVLYIGVTNNLERRITEHYIAGLENHFGKPGSPFPGEPSAKKKSNSINGKPPTSFAGKYKCHDLVYYESYSSIKNAIAREKELKKWHRKWKDELISDANPGWQSLNQEIFEIWPPGQYPLI